MSKRWLRVFAIAATIAAALVPEARIGAMTAPPSAAHARLSFARPENSRGQTIGRLGRRCDPTYCPQPPVIYYGGSVQHAPDVHLIYWGSNWQNTSAGTSTANALNTMYNGFNASTYQAILAQYTDTTGRVGLRLSVDSWNDTSVAAPSGVDYGPISNEVAKAIGATNWTQDGNSQFVVLTAPGSTYASGFGTDFCAWHMTSFPSYSFVPYAGDEPFYTGCAQSQGIGATNATTDFASHEYAESATDPFGDGWRTSDTSQVLEIGDICATAPDFVAGLGWVQGEWSNAANACVLAASAWSDWNSLSGVLASGTSAASGLLGNTDRIDTFAIAGSGQNQLYQKTWNGSSWGAWTLLGHPNGVNLSGTPASVVWKNGAQLDVFARGSDGQLWQRQWNSSWGSWIPLGGVIQPGVSAVSPSANVLDVFVVAGSSGDTLFQKHWAGSWGSWTSVGRPSSTGLTPSPGAVTWSGGRIDVFATGADGALWQIVHPFGGTWSSWHNLGGGLQSGPTAVSAADGRLDVFAIAGSSGDHLWKRSFAGTSWGAWTDLGRPASTGVNAQPGSVARDGRVDVFPPGADGAMWQIFNPGIAL